VPEMEKFMRSENSETLVILSKTLASLR
jgi:hypothetical protein